MKAIMMKERGDMTDEPSDIEEHGDNSRNENQEEWDQKNSQLGTVEKSQLQS